jgi:tetratricopeptide (TPR) repeat protein
MMESTATRAFFQGELRPMKLTARVPVTAGLMALLVCSATGCKRLRANDQINKGVADFKNARYESAENHFQNAVDIDPDYMNARIYLATTYSSQVVPNLDTPDNKKIAQQALDGFQEVLRRDPNNVNALKQIATLDRNMGKPEDAKLYEKKVIAQDPNDAEANYTIGVVDWLQAYKNATTVLAGEGMQDKSDGNVKLSKAGCAKLSEENTPLVTEGLNYLKKATEINPNYEEAYTYLSLMSRRKADLECGDQAAIKQDLADADMYAQKSMGARKENERIKEEKSHGVTQ